MKRVFHEVCLISCVCRLVTTRFKLSEANEAFECLLKGKDSAGNLIMKLIISDS